MVCPWGSLRKGVGRIEPERCFLGLSAGFRPKPRTVSTRNAQNAICYWTQARPERADVLVVGRLAEWFKALVLKTSVGHKPTGGSNPSPSASMGATGNGQFSFLATHCHPLRGVRLGNGCFPHQANKG